MLNSNSIPSDLLKKALPDVAAASVNQLASNLDWVGMSGIEVPLLLLQSDGSQIRIPGRAQSFVSLDVPTARGIHMSRLFKSTQEMLSQNILNFDLLKETLDQFLQTHEGLSKSAHLSVDFEAMISRKALKTENWGWRSYPVKMKAEIRDGVFERSLELQVTYSSTCPASAALSRSLIQDNFKESFRGSEDLDFKKIFDWLGTSQGILATPHAQRSFAKVQIVLTQDLAPEVLIDLLEDTLQTPVQSVVKREDEQEFALRNGQNLMFCEDAARRLKFALKGLEGVSSFRGEVRHIESLHPHDAVSFFSN